jgi:hypothetical protein
MRNNKMVGRNKMKNKGVMLIEVSIILSIIAIVLAIAVPPVFKQYISYNYEKVSEIVVNKEYKTESIGIGRNSPLPVYTLEIETTYVGKNKTLKFHRFEVVDVIDYDRYMVGHEWKGRRK